MCLSELKIVFEFFYSLKCNASYLPNEKSRRKIGNDMK